MFGNIERLEDFDMAKYKVNYSGFAYVEADTPEEAEDIYEHFSVYEETQIDSVEEVDEFIVEL